MSITFSYRFRRCGIVSPSWRCRSAVSYRSRCRPSSASSLARFPSLTATSRTSPSSSSSLHAATSCFALVVNVTSASPSGGAGRVSRLTQIQP